LHPENAEDKKDAPKYAATKIAQPEEDTKNKIQHTQKPNQKGEKTIE